MHLALVDHLGGAPDIHTFAKSRVKVVVLFF